MIDDINFNGGLNLLGLKKKFLILIATPCCAFAPRSCTQNVITSNENCTWCNYV